ncbi:MAG: twin-arginine translocase TatA/TatE family subunit [Bacteroidales bacterium]|jgi:sec-independent protein translocase protein TatA|nr:twin-arginine translocase TatA/TatE family subunit [Bacteroidales bacterium]
MLTYPLFIGTWEIVIIALVIVLILGGKKIPELMKGLGKGVRSFKEGISEVDEQVSDIKKELEKPAETKSEEVKKQD